MNPNTLYYHYNIPQNSKPRSRTITIFQDSHIYVSCSLLNYLTTCPCTVPDNKICLHDLPHIYLFPIQPHRSWNCIVSIKTSALSSGQRLPQPPEIKLSVTQRNLRQIACFRSRVVDYYSVIHLKYGTTTLQPYHHMPVRVSLSGLSICLHPTLHRVARALHYHPPVARDSCTVRPQQVQFVPHSLVVCL